jgi:glutaredoxin
MSTRLTLYATAACHLCERAEALLASMPELRRCELRIVDISTSQELLERYAESIPVLTCKGRELRWPFNADDVLMLAGNGPAE